MVIEQSIADAVAEIRKATNLVPKTIIVLGSGLGFLADAVTAAHRFDSTNLPSYPTSTVAGHEGAFLLGFLDGHPVAMVQGRFHPYEGYNVDESVFPINLGAALGATHLVVTNAAGGISHRCDVGSIMFISDHVFLNRPSKMPSGLRGDQKPATRHTARYDSNWIKATRDGCARNGIATEVGVYGWVSGPPYETPAEIRAYRTMGADAVGMSTALEVQAAVQRGLRTIGISTITNKASGLGGTLDHDDVIATGGQTAHTVAHVLKTALAVA